MNVAMDYFLSMQTSPASDASPMVRVLLRLVGIRSSVGANRTLPCPLPSQ
jgi:hypothetical protein